MLTFSESVVALVRPPLGPGAAHAAAVCLSGDGHTRVGVLADPAVTPAFTAESPFIIYSITKTLLAIAALRLVERDGLALDVPLARWLPAVPHADRITLRHLLRHASGLPDYGGLAAYHDAVKRGDAPWSDDAFFANTAAEHLVFPPGRGWRYSNIGYMVVRQLLEAVQTASLTDIIAAELCAPLGLTATAVVTDDAQLAGLTFGPSVELGSAEKPVEVAGRYHVGWVAHGVVASTVREIARIFDVLFAGQLLGPPLLREMCTSIPLPPMPDRPFLRPGYGMGLQIDHGWPQGPVYGHSGEGPGAQLNVISLRNESHPLTVVVATPGEDLVQTETIAATLLREHLAG